MLLTKRSFLLPFILLAWKNCSIEPDTLTFLIYRVHLILDNLLGQNTVGPQLLIWIVPRIRANQVHFNKTILCFCPRLHKTQYTASYCLFPTTFNSRLQPMSPLIWASHCLNSSSFTKHSHTVVMQWTTDCTLPATTGLLHGRKRNTFPPVKKYLPFMSSIHQQNT